MVIITRTNKRFIPLRTRKTYQDDRMTYSYEYANGDKYTLEIDKDGITEADIKLLHSLEDSEVYNNCKNARPERTKEEKDIIKAWRENFIEEFKNNNGYEPQKSDVNYYENEKFPRNYNLSLDADLVNFDKSAIENMVVKNTEFEWTDEILTAFEILTDNEKLVIEKIYLENMKKIDIAAEMGISNAMVTKYHKKALEKLRMKI
jgi:DNA-directed sigma24-like RNA polymerase